MILGLGVSDSFLSYVTAEFGDVVVIGETIADLSDKACIDHSATDGVEVVTSHLGSSVEPVEVCFSELTFKVIAKRTNDMLFVACCGSSTVLHVLAVGDEDCVAPGHGIQAIGDVHVVHTYQDREPTTLERSTFRLEGVIPASTKVCGTIFPCEVDVAMNLVEVSGEIGRNIFHNW